MRENQVTPAQREVALDDEAVCPSAYKRYEARESRYVPQAGSH